MELRAWDADDPTAGANARLTYSILRNARDPQVGRGVVEGQVGGQVG